MDLIIDRLILANLLFARLVTLVVRDAEIFIVVATLFEVVNLIGTHPEMKIEYFFVFAAYHMLFDFFNIGVSVLRCHFDNGAVDSFEGVGREVFRDKLGGVDVVVPENFEASQQNLVKHISRIYFINNIKKNRLCSSSKISGTAS